MSASARLERPGGRPGLPGAARRRRAPARAVFSSAAGQAMIESVVVMMVICLLFFGLLQLAHAFAGREVLRHAAARAARARAVGFNGWMVTKVMRAAAIPNAGRMIAPETGFPDPLLRQAVDTLGPGALWDWSLAATPRQEQARLESARIPDYLASENEARARHILDYERWDDIRCSGAGGSGFPGGAPRLARIEVRQRYPLTIFVRALFDWVGALSSPFVEGALQLRGEYEIENHYPLYLEDEGL